jgi:hypothetical protein
MYDVPKISSPNLPDHEKFHRILGSLGLDTRYQILISEGFTVRLKEDNPQYRAEGLVRGRIYTDVTKVRQTEGKYECYLLRTDSGRPIGVPTYHCEELYPSQVPQYSPVVSCDLESFKNGNFLPKVRSPLQILRGLFSRS